MKYDDPNWRRGTGIAQEIVYLPGEAALAVGLHMRIYGADDRAKARAEVDTQLATAQNAAPADQLAAFEPYRTLALGGDMPARNRTGDSMGLRHQWALVREMRELADRLAPPVPIAHEDANRCQHGKLFTDDCRECGE